jgi:hypothetical protein
MRAYEVIQMSAAKVTAKDVLASLKSGVLLKGTVRSHSTAGSTNIAWIALELPVVGERQVLVADEQNLRPGQQVVIECVPNLLKPGSYRFRLVEVLMPKPVGAMRSLAAGPKSRCSWRSQCKGRRRAASKK